MSWSRVRVVFSLALIVSIVLPIIAAELYLQHLGLGDPILYYTNNSYRYAPLPN